MKAEAIICIRKNEKRPGLGGLRPRQRREFIMISKINCYTIPPQSQNKLADNRSLFWQGSRSYSCLFY